MSYEQKCTPPPPPPVEVLMYIHTYMHAYIHTSMREVCILVVVDTYIPPFGGCYEVCMLAEEHTYIPPFRAGVRYVC